MATYKHRFTPATGNDPDISLFHVVERPLYGSSRLGVDAQEVDLATATPTAPTTAHPGQWRYELTDHLGNVQAVVTEELLGLDGNNDQSVDQWAPVLLSAQDYEPFGSLLPGRNYSSDSYRYGLNGQEKDDEIYGATGTSYTAEFWQYDPRVGRRWNIDPVDKPWMSPYHAFSNKPITNVDPNGANDDWYQSDDNRIVWFDRDDKSFSDDQGTNWNNVGEGLDDVKYHLGLSGPPTDEKTQSRHVVFLGGKRADWKGVRRGAPGPVKLDRSSRVSTSLIVENAGLSQTKLRDGESEVTGVQFNFHFSVHTLAPPSLVGSLDRLNGTFSVGDHRAAFSQYTGLSWQSSLGSTVSGTAQVQISTSEYLSQRNLSSIGLSYHFSGGVSLGGSSFGLNHGGIWRAQFP